MKSELSDFVRRYPSGSTCHQTVANLEKPLRAFIPQYYTTAAAKEAILELAILKGYTPDEIAWIRQVLYRPPELVLVPINEE